MKIYWALSLAFFAILIGSTVVIKTASVAEGVVLGENSVGQRSLINPTDYIRKLTETPVRKLTEAARKPIINPTEHIKRLTGNPIPSLTGMAEKKQRLSDEKLRICEEKSKKIIGRSTALGEKASEMEKKFTAIVSGVKEYYTTKGLQLENYDQLIASLEEKKNVIIPLVEAAKTSLDGFTCTGENPSGRLKIYHDDMQAVLAALHEYRVSIKDLITAIKGLRVAESSISPTSTPQS